MSSGQSKAGTETLVSREIDVLAEKQFNVGTSRLVERGQRDRSASSLVYGITPPKHRPLTSESPPGRICSETADSRQDYNPPVGGNDHTSRRPISVAKVDSTQENVGSNPDQAILISVFHGSRKLLYQIAGMAAYYMPWPIPPALLLLLIPCSVSNNDLAVDKLSTGSAGMKGRGKREIPEKTRRPTASSCTIPICENPVTRPGIEPGSPLGGRRAWESLSHRGLLMRLCLIFKTFTGHFRVNVIDFGREGKKIMCPKTPFGSALVLSIATVTERIWSSITLISDSVNVTLRMGLPIAVVDKQHCSLQTGFRNAVGPCIQCFNDFTSCFAMSLHCKCITQKTLLAVRPGVACLQPDGGNRRSPRKPAGQRHRPVRFPYAKIRSDPAGDFPQIALMGGEQAKRSAP
ncbi:hypothetical protein PR048_008297 [Dryococelus australis]|uniref:Uncharacterized protein n=1 Tax=Dryococelus australis TaxID=614101 RepID=A0ABQ9HXL7_9NEOP|nr:hypothetical protein PR048_008297 [Dryococelus australis]